MGQHSKRSRAAAVTAALTATGAMAATTAAALPGTANAAPAERIPEHLTPATTTTAVVHAAKPAAVPRTYKVRSGDNLSAIAQRFCGSPSRWPNLWGGNYRTIGANPNVIYPGQLLQVTRLACRAVARLWTPPTPVVTTVSTVTPEQAPVQHAAAPVATVTGFSGGSVAAAYTAFPGASCIVTRESGGNRYAVNPQSGAGGLFQDLPSTWAGYDGYPTAESAPVSVQIAFNQQLAATSGLSPWAADGCPGT